MQPEMTTESVAQNTDLLICDHNDFHKRIVTAIESCQNEITRYVEFLHNKLMSQVVCWLFWKMVSIIL